MNYILVILAAVLYALDFAIKKSYQTINGTGLFSGTIYNLLSGIFKALIFFAICGFTFEFTTYSLIMSFIKALAVILYTLLSFKIFKDGSMALFSVFLMCGGMLLPYVFGLVFLNEQPTALKLIGVILMAIAVALSGFSRVKIKTSTLLLCVLVFILNGIVSIVSKLHSIADPAIAISSNAFVMYSGLGSAFFAVTTLPFCKPKSEPKFSYGPKVILLSAASAVISGAGFLFQLIGAKDLDASILFPIITGGTIIFTSLAGLLFFKEKLSKVQVLSIILCFTATLFFLNF